MKKFPTSVPKTKDEMVERLKTMADHLDSFDPFIVKLHKKFGWIDFMRSMIPGSEKTIKKVIDKIKPKTILELGTIRGVATAFMAQYCDKVITVDITDNDIKKKIWDYFKVTDKIESHIVSDWKKVAKRLEGLDFDLVVTNRRCCGLIWSGKNTLVYDDPYTGQEQPKLPVSFKKIDNMCLHEPKDKPKKKRTKKVK